MGSHSPIDNTTETYDLSQYHKQNESSYFLDKLTIPTNTKQKILNELESIYSISHDSIYLKNGFLETKYSSEFKTLKENSRLMTLYMTDADQLDETEALKARSMFRIECRNMFGNCINLR